VVTHQLQVARRTGKGRRRKTGTLPLSHVLCTVNTYNRVQCNTQHIKGHEYQPKGSDALLLGSKGRYGSWVGGRWNCV